MTNKVTEALQEAEFWLDGALNCKSWEWSPDQKDAAFSSHDKIKDALAALSTLKPEGEQTSTITSEPKGHWEDGGKVWVEDHDCYPPVSNPGENAALVNRLTSNPADHRYWEGRYRDEAARAETAETLLDEARRALEPFVAYHDRYFDVGGFLTDEYRIIDQDDDLICTVGDLRRARATLDRIGK